MTEVISWVNLGLIIVIMAILIVVSVIALGGTNDFGVGDVNLAVTTGSVSTLKGVVDTKANSLFVVPCGATGPAHYKVTFKTNKSDDDLDKKGRIIYVSNQSTCTGPLGPSAGVVTDIHTEGSGGGIVGMGEPGGGAHVCPGELGIFVSVGENTYSRIDQPWYYGGTCHYPVLTLTGTT